MKEFPCCPAAKKNRGSGKAGTRQAARGPAPLGGLHEEHVLHNHRKKSCSSTAGKPWAILTRGHPSVQTSLSTKGHPHRPPGNRHLGTSTGPTTIFSWTFTCKGKASLRSSSEYKDSSRESSLDLHNQLKSLLLSERADLAWLKERFSILSKQCIKIFLANARHAPKQKETNPCLFSQGLEFLPWLAVWKHHHAQGTCTGGGDTSGAAQACPWHQGVCHCTC